MDMTEIRIQVAEEVDRYLDAAVKNGLFTNKAEIARAALIQYMSSINLMSRNYDDELVFSPEGRIYQLEYARNAVIRSFTSVGISCKDGVLICCGKPVPEKLQPLRTDTRKIFEIGERVILTYSGLIADGNLVIDVIREAKPRNNMQLKESIRRAYRPFLYERNKRPLGVGFLIGSLLEKPVIFYADPAGGISEYKAAAMGSGADDATSLLETKYREMTTVNAEKLAIEALGETFRSTGNYELRILKTQGS
ncbi:MAG: hypothetical protein KIS29_07060 [Thermoplasmata archaeon]|nr:hypothetical protein [Candidatus Sysuiplasma jiujiangense]